MWDTEFDVERAESPPAGRGPETQKLGEGVSAPPARPRPVETRKLDLEAGSPSPGRAAALHLGLTRQEMQAAAIAHAGILVTLLLGVFSGGLLALLGPAIPAVLWYAYRDRSEYVVEQARQALVFQLAGFLAWLGLIVAGTILIVLAWLVTALLTLALVGLVLVPVALILTLALVLAVIGLPIAQAVYGCYAAAEASNGRPFRYWWIADLLDRDQVQA
jgi:uncharacterized Tic20 family protein